jgi:protein O-GlcNAc transferase
MSMTRDMTFETGMGHLRAGRHGEAEKIFRDVLSARPNHADALHMLGVIALQGGRYDEAADLIGRALPHLQYLPEAHGNMGAVRHAQQQWVEAAKHYRKALSLHEFPSGYFRLGEVLQATEKWDEAVVAYKRAIELQPIYAEANSNLGNVYYSQGKLEEATACYEQALKIKPNLPEAHNNLGNIYQAQRKWPEAMKCYRRAIQLRPDYPDAHSNLSVALVEQQQLDEAIQEALVAIKLNPKLAGAYNNLGNAYTKMGNLDEASTAFDKALQINPVYAEAIVNLGNVFQERDQYDDAIRCYKRALEVNPKLVGATNNLGTALQALGKMQEAIKCFRKVIELEPEHYGAHGNLGNILQATGRPEESKKETQRALELNPDVADFYCNLGNACKDLGELDDAIAHYRKAVELSPDYAAVHSNLVYTIHFHAGYDAQSILRENRAWDVQHAQPLKDKIRPHLNDRSPDRRLRIGYVSPDFRDHCQSFFTHPLLSHHDHENFEIFTYSLVINEDDVTRRLKTYVDKWNHVLGKSQDEIAEKIREDKIDILVDLTMHMANNQIQIFARKPAPVQVSWLAYPSTTGVAAIDYRITDPYLDPPGKYDEEYSEKSIRLPDTFWCYDLSHVGLGDGDSPNVSILPAELLGYITFGSLNNFCKVSDRALELWAKTLHALPRSRLVLLCHEGDGRRRVSRTLEKNGIEPDRFEFVERLSRREYLDMYRRIDIGLDTLPYNGHTTSLDSFWMGVPVVTRIGETIVGRAGWSQLSNLNLRELAAENDEQFVKIAVDLAKDLPRLADLRAGLRRRILNSPLTDGVKFTKGMEAAFRQMWRTWCESAM